MAEGLTTDELSVLLRIVMSVQGEVVLGRYDEKTVARLAGAFADVSELSSIEAKDARVVEGLERINHHVRLALGEVVEPERARPLE
ncbi:MAG TPA: hypothetical protein VFX60_04875 [Micromonospora sp.]|nr:hypothetical protein [Micromonospora sp.]